MASISSESSMLELRQFNTTNGLKVPTAGEGRTKAIVYEELLRAWLAVNIRSSLRANYVNFKGRLYPLNFSNHAAERAEEREVGEDEIIFCLRTRPHIQLTDWNDRWVARNTDIKVIFSFDASHINIITTARLDTM